MNFWSNNCLLDREVLGQASNTPTPWFMGWYPKQSSRFTLSCDLQSWNQVRFGVFNEFDLEFENPFDAQIQSEFESEKWAHMNQTQECISSKPCEVKAQLCSSFCWHLPLQHLPKASDCPNAKCPHLTIHKWSLTNIQRSGYTSHEHYENALSGTSILQAFQGLCSLSPIRKKSSCSCDLHQ